MTLQRSEIKWPIMSLIDKSAVIPRLSGRPAIFLILFLRAIIVDQANAEALPNSVTMTVSDPRPVESAVLMLVSRFGYVITYEDPPYSYEGDLQDVTTQVRKDLANYPPGKAPKVIVPAGDVLSLSVPTSSTVDAASLATVLEKLVHTQSHNRHGAHFRVEQSGDVFHVVPTEWRDRDGNWIQRGSIFDTPISFPPQDLSAFEMLTAICKAVSTAAHVHVVVGAGAEWFSGRYRVGADNEPAEDVLMRALTNLEAKMTWVLLYDSGQPVKSYFLSLVAVPDSGSAASKPMSASPPGGSQKGSAGEPGDR